MSVMLYFNFMNQKYNNFREGELKITNNKKQCFSSLKKGLKL